MKRYIYIILTTAILALSSATSKISAQHIVGITGGFGTATSRLYPAFESRTIYGLQNYGVTWRTYSSERFVGGVGVDIEYMQRGFSFSPNASFAAEGATIYYYTRKINSIMVPIVWQPHAYIFHRRVRVFAEAAATFSYDINSTYDNDYQRQYDTDRGIEGVWSGDYEYLSVRDNRFGYGLAGGGGLSLLVGEHIEIMARVRYYFGLSDIVRNRNKYYTNNYDGSENPFSLTPLRSPIDNLNFSFGIAVHLGKKGFDVWSVKPPKRERDGAQFNYDGPTNENR